MVGIGGTLLLLVCCGFFATNKACTVLQEETGLETKYEFWNGCFVKLDDRWVPQDNWREQK